MFESEADRRAFLSADIGGELIELDGTGLRAIFNDAHVPLPFGDQFVTSSEPQIIGTSVDLAEIKDTSIIRVRGIDYRVAAIEPDGTGMTVVKLRE